MSTTVINNNIESKNGMSQVVIDLRPKVKHQDGHGREVLADVHFRIDVQAYTANLYTYTKEAREESEKACEAYYSEVVELLKAEGWTLRKEKFGVGDCPQMVKGTQYLYCHPQDISGQVNPADIETLEAKIKALTSCKFYKTDNYGDIIVTTSESDEKQLYHDTYADGLGAIWQEVTTTKRSNLYKDKAEAEHCVRRRICIANRRADLNDIGTGSYNMRSPLLQFLMEEYDRLLQAGYIKEATGQNGRTLCRWINKKEEKELTKARREAEKAEKERKAQEWQEFLDREAEKQNSFAEGMRVKVPAASLERNRDKEAFVITRIRRKAADNGGNASLTVKSELTGVEKDINGSDVSEILPALQEASEIKDTEFFTKGKKYRCIKSVKGNFAKGKVYEQSSDPTQWYGYFLNDKGILHVWPQPTQIDHCCDLYDMKPEDIDPRLYFEPVEEIKGTEDVKVGDRVKVKSQDTPADVTAISEDGKYFTVKFLHPVRGFWTDNTMQTATYSRYGITRNYDRMTGEEIVGNAQYYAEQLKYGPGSIIEYELAGVALRTESTREDVEPDSREGWGNEYRVTIHHQTGDTTETMTLSETAELLARMYQEEQGKAATLEPASEITEADFSDTLADDLKAGDRVLSRHYGAQATVLGREWDKQRKAWYYRVKFDTMQRHMDGSEFNVTEFHRDGLTKNYDPATGRERVGNAEYYRENLLAEFWGNDRTPRTVYDMEIFKPTDRRPSWLVVADIFSEPKEMTLREVCDMLAARYQEEQGKAA